MNFRLSITLSFLFLAGCMTPEQIAARQQQEVLQRQQQEQQYRAQIESVCSSYGIKPGTPSFMKCAKEVHNDNLRQQDIAKRKQAAFWACGGQGGSFGESAAAGNACAANYDRPETWSINQPKKSTQTRCEPTITGGFNCHSY